MARRIKVKLVMELRDQEVSQNEISRTRHISPRSVGDVCRIARERNIVHADIAELNDDEAYRLFFLEQTVSESVFAESDYEWVHKEYAKRGVTLSMLHAEYRVQCERDKPLLAARQSSTRVIVLTPLLKTLRATTLTRRQSAQKSIGRERSFAPPLQQVSKSRSTSL